MLRLLTAGESHGPALTVLVDGLPAGVPVRREVIDSDLRRRQSGYGRGGRMAIETDTVEILSGIRHGRTLGSPVSLVVRNRDHENWKDVMSPDPVPEGTPERRVLRYPRPGHADLAGAVKYQTRDFRNILERASARETTMRVAGGAVARELLSALGIEVRSHVLRIGAAAMAEGAPVAWERLEGIERSSVRCSEADVAAAMVAEIDAAKKRGDSVGGIFEVVARGVPPGLGAFAQWDRRLDGRLAQALMSIHAVKAVSIGDGFRAGEIPGSLFHDEILHEPRLGIHRPTNHAGGIEGGITNGEEIRAQAVVKPIPTLLMALRSVDVQTMQPQPASVERSDTCVLPAAGVVGEAMLCLVLADAMLEKFGGDSLGELVDHLQSSALRAREFLAPMADPLPEEA